MEKRMAISDLLSVADVILDVSAGNKRSLLEVLSDEAASRLGRSSQEILEALRDREQIGSTALGRGVALPHAELSGTHPPIVLFTRLQRPIEFDARDDEPVDLVFLVLWPAGGGKGILPTISEICRALREPQSLRRLRLAKTPEEVVELVRQLTVPGPDVAREET
jgi:PTS system nitrogen regulatory IIA component